MTTNKIDWNKPIEYFSVDSWHPARVVCSDIKDKFNRVIAFNKNSIEIVTTVNPKGQVIEGGTIRVRNCQPKKFVVTLEKKKVKELTVDKYHSFVVGREPDGFQGWTVASIKEI